jgi:hypothetical protein
MSLAFFFSNTLLISNIRKSISFWSEKNNADKPLTTLTGRQSSEFFSYLIYILLAKLPEEHQNYATGGKQLNFYNL